MDSWHLPKGLVLRKTFIDVPSTFSTSRRSRSCPARLCNINSDVLKGLLTSIRSLEERVEHFISDAQLFTNVGKNMLQLLNCVTKNHTFFVLKRSQTWRKLYGVHSISDCLGCFFGISPTTLEACYKSCLPHYDDALRECTVVCLHLSTLLKNGLILVVASKGGIF